MRGSACGNRATRSGACGGGDAPANGAWPGGLATVAATAPFLGIIGTLCGIYGSVRGCSEKTACMAATMGFLSDAILPSAVGLALAITASSGRKYMAARLENFDIAMRNAALEMPGYLTPLAQR